MNSVGGVNVLVKTQNKKFAWNSLGGLFFDSIDYSMMAEKDKEWKNTKFEVAQRLKKKNADLERQRASWKLYNVDLPETHWEDCSMIVRLLHDSTAQEWVKEPCVSFVCFRLGRKTAGAITRVAVAEHVSVQSQGQATGDRRLSAIPRLSVPSRYSRSLSEPSADTENGRWPGGKWRAGLTIL